jgi:hypothetical protein
MRSGLLLGFATIIVIPIAMMSMHGASVLILEALLILDLVWLNRHASKKYLRKALIPFVVLGVVGPLTWPIYRLLEPANLDVNFDHGLRTLRYILWAYAFALGGCSLAMAISVLRAAARLRTGGTDDARQTESRG